MQMGRLIAPKIKMTNISRISAFLEQHSSTLEFNQHGVLKADTGYLVMIASSLLVLYDLNICFALF